MHGQNGLVEKCTLSFINTGEDWWALVLTGKTRYIAQQWVEILFEMHVERGDLKVFIIYRPCVLA